MQGIYLGKISIKDVYGLERNFIIVGHDIGGRRFINPVYSTAFTPEEDLILDNMVLEEVNLPPNSDDQQRRFETANDAGRDQSSKILPKLDGKEGRIIQYLILSGPGIHASVDLWDLPGQVTETDIQLLHPADDLEYDSFISKITTIVPPDKQNASILATFQSERLYKSLVAMYVEDGKRLGYSFNVPGVDLNLIGNNPDQEILAELSFDTLVNIAKKGPLTGMVPWEFTTGSGWKILQDKPLFEIQ